jgi:thiosulfate/3-mercaptopyruvate sulfurtransferase
MAFTTLIDTETLARHLTDPAFAIFDCRFKLEDVAWGEREYSARHIPGAIHADLEHDLSGKKTGLNGRHPLPDAAVLADTFGRVGIDASVQVVAYDQDSGVYASRLWWMLRWLGHPEAAVLDGGYRAWVSGGGAVASGEEPPLHPNDKGGRFVPRVDVLAVIGAAEVAARLTNERFSLVDARAPERFAGAVEPIDTVAGHVPGAVNQPFSENLAPDGRFLAAPELRRRWLKRLEGKEPANVAAMCGSGVTACHNLLALEVAGLGGAKLYAGSWSEWIRDSSRPIARGA